MKQQLVGFSQHYALALRKHLKLGSPTSLFSAVRLGNEALALGLKREGLVRIHESSILLPKSSGAKNGQLKRGESFLTLASAPFGEAPRAARPNKLPARPLKTPVIGHAVHQNVMAPNAKDNGRWLQESLLLQNQLRKLTHGILRAQEDERLKISHELQDEIAQILMGINVQLLSLRQRARHNPKDLKNEIVSTQRLVAESAKSVRLFARELARKPRG